MSLSSALRSDRLKRLHRRFLDKGDRHSTFCHAAVSAQHPKDWNRIQPPHLDHEMIEDDLQDEESYQFLRALVRKGVVIGRWEPEISVRRQRLTFDSLSWIGCFLDYDLDDDGDSIICFEDLAADALAAFSQSVNSAWSNDWLEGQTTRWLQTVYDTLHEPYEIIGPSSGSVGGPAGEVTIASLRSNVFFASARAIELLAEEPEKHKPVRKNENPNDARDRWIYKQAMKKVPWKAIRTELQTKCDTSDWFPIGTDNGIRGRAFAYARRNKLPEPPPRQERSV
jgi:hypothetical protein